jgi:hypothetical protein
VHPDLPDLAGRILHSGFWVDDPHRGRPRYAAADELDTAFVVGPLRVAGRQLLVVEPRGRRRPPQTYSAVAPMAADASTSVSAVMRSVAIALSL